MNNLKANAAWLLRLVLTAVFFYHGFNKFPRAAMMAASMGMPLSMPYLLGTSEVFAGVLMLLGGLKLRWSVLATKTAAVIFAVIMIGAITLVHWPRWIEIELPIALLAISVYLLLKADEV